MRFRVAAFLGVSAACAAVLDAACFQDLITDAPPIEAGLQGLRCGDGIITLGQYDGGFADLDAGEQCDPGADSGQVSGCSAACRLDCDGGILDPITDHCYFVAAPATSLNEGDNSAEQECETAGGHAVTYVDERERQFVIDGLGQRATLGDASVFWMGLTFVGEKGGYVVTQESEQEPGWLPTCSGCYSPPNVDGSIPRLILDAGGQCILDAPPYGWSQFPCTQIPRAIPVLCEREPPGAYNSECNGGRCISVPITAGRKRYLFAFSNATADQAEGACHDLGGSLVVFETLEEREAVLREAVRAVANGAITREAWIGYSMAEAGTPFVWDLDGGLTSSPWGDNQPILDASAPVRAYVTLDPANYDVQLAHDDTNVPRPYICQY